MSESMFTKRLFIAAPIESAEVQTELVAVRSRVQAAFPDVKFHWEDQSHITLRFLGDVDIIGVSGALRELQKEIKQIAEENDPFDLALGYLYTFPGILWVRLGRIQEHARSFGYSCHPDQPGGARLWIPGCRPRLQRTHHHRTIRAQDG